MNGAVEPASAPDAAPGPTPSRSFTREAQASHPVSMPMSTALAKQVQTRLGQAIRRRRRAQDLTQSQLAAACGVTYQQVQKYEVGRCSISASQLWVISVALETPIADFYDALTT